MNHDDLRGRRATSDDVSALEQMWRTTGLRLEALEPKFTEFQVVEDPLGSLVAAVGIRVAGKDALLHDETIPEFGAADAVRPVMWQRLQAIATHNGVIRVWTQESAAFWRQAGFNQASGDDLAKLPAPFRTAEGSWFLLVLRDEDLIKRAEQEFALFHQEEQARTEQLKSQGKIWQWIATVIAITLFVFVVVGAVRLLKSAQKRSGLTAPSAHQASAPAGLIGSRSLRAGLEPGRP